MTRLIIALVVLIGVAVTNAWKHDEFVGTTSESSAQSSGFETSPIPNTSTAHTYSAPDASFTVTFPGVAAESPDVNALWGDQTHRTHEVTATTGDMTTSIRFADFTTGELPANLDALGDWLCRSLGANPDDKQTEVVDGHQAVRCRLHNGVIDTDHQFFRVGNRVYDLSTAYDNVDVSGPVAFETFVASFQSA